MWIIYAHQIPPHLDFASPQAKTRLKITNKNEKFKLSTFTANRDCI